MQVWAWIALLGLSGVEAGLKGVVKQRQSIIFPGSFMAARFLGRRNGGGSRRLGVRSSTIDPPVKAPPAPPQNTIRKKYGGGRNRSDGVYLLSQLSTFQLSQEWKDRASDRESEFRLMLPKILIWSTGIEYPYPVQWSVIDYPPKFVLGYYRNNVIESILLARGTTPEYAPHALTFVVDYIVVDPRKDVNVALPVLEKMRKLGISFQVPIDWSMIQTAYGGEIEKLRNSLGPDPSFNYWVMQNSGKMS